MTNGGARPSPQRQMFSGFSLRRQALDRACPTCGALRLTRRLGARGKPRQSLHADRIALARGEQPA